jgi:hypothetical protein
MPDFKTKEAAAGFSADPVLKGCDRVLFSRVVVLMSSLIL